MNKKVLLLLVAVLFTASLLFVFLSRSETEQAATGEKAGERSETTSSSSFVKDSGFAEAGMDDAFFSADPETFLDSVRSGEIDLVQNLKELRSRKCTASMNIQSCTDVVSDFIQGKFSGSTQEQLQELLEKFNKYEAEFATSGLHSYTQFRKDTGESPQEYLVAVRALRNRVLEPDEVRLLFGQEEALMDYRLALFDLQKRAPNLAPEKREQEYDRIFQETLGDFEKLFSSPEARQERFDVELRLFRLGGPSDADLLAYKRKLQLKYFGADQP